MGKKGILKLLFLLFFIYAGCKTPCNLTDSDNNTTRSIASVWKLSSTSGGIHGMGNHSIDYDGIKIDGMQINYYKNNILVGIEPFSYVLTKSIRTGKEVKMMELKSSLILEMVINGNIMILYENVYDGYQYNFIKTENN